MTLRELMTAIALRQSGSYGFEQPAPGIVPTGLSYTRRDTWWVEFRTVPCGWLLTRELTADPSPTSDPLDAELR